MVVKVGIFALPLPCCLFNTPHPQAVREASARSLPTFSACQYADVYAAVGSVYARLSRDPELTPRKALMRRTPDLVQARPALPRVPLSTLLYGEQGY